MVGDAAATHGAHSLALEIIRLAGLCWHIPLPKDDLNTAHIPMSAFCSDQLRCNQLHSAWWVQQNIKKGLWVMHVF